jgi:uncharacterized protein (TIGR02466 family)
MEIYDWFVTPISKVNHPELIPAACTLFEKHKDKFQRADDEDEFYTTLKRYNAFWCNESSINLTQDPDAKWIIDSILKRSKEFLDKIGYDTTSVNLKILNMWMNKMKHGAENPRHSHGGGIVSGCFYVKIPKNSSAIYFHNPTLIINRAKLPILEYTKYSSKCVSFYPVEGDLYIWESHLEHEVPYHNDAEERYVIAFDITAEYKE